MKQVKVIKGLQVSGTGTKIGKYSVETLNRDQTRTVVEKLLDNGEISLKVWCQKEPKTHLNLQIL